MCVGEECLNDADYPLVVPLPQLFQRQECLCA